MLPGFSILIIVVARKIAQHTRRSQQLLDAFGFIEPLVDAEADVGCELEIHTSRHFTAQVSAIAVEGGENFAPVATAERHDVDRGEAQIRAHAHLGHRDDVAPDHRIPYVSPSEDLGESVTDQLTNPQLAGRRISL